MPSFLGNSFNGPATKRLAEGCASDIIPTTATGGLAANSLLACEILAFLLQGTDLVDREPVFAPRFAMVDFLSQKMAVGDVIRGE